MQIRFKNVLIGLPTGSILAPIAFAMFIYNLSDFVRDGKTYTFVDDSNFVYVGTVDKLEELQNTTNKNMRSVVFYFVKNKLHTNPNGFN